VCTSSAIQVQNISTAVAISAGGSHTCALLKGGQVECWGNNGWGQLGNGSLTNSSSPVLAISGASAVAAGYEFTCAVVSGNVWCWGINDEEQLGMTPVGCGSNGQYCVESPMQVSGVSGATGIAAGFYHACALLSGGTVKCWGDDAYGQLGYTTSSTCSTAQASGDACQTVPQAVTGLNGASAIVAGAVHTCAVLSSGALECWGQNEYGQLGVGSTPPLDSTSPVAPNLSNVVQVAAGTESTCALLTTGVVDCWGDDTYGELGTNGSNTSIPEPSSW